jgi:hypothetical protein
MRLTRSLFLLLILASAGEASAACIDAISSATPLELRFTKDPNEIEKLRPTWNPANFSDPRHHDADNFMYIVRVGPLEADAAYLSASVISNDCTGTYQGSWAYILEVPASQVIASLPKDSGNMGTTNERKSLSPATVQSFIKWYGFYDPKFLVKETTDWAARYNYQSAYNEVFIKTSQYNDAQKIKIIGVVTPPNRYPGDSMERDASEAAARLGLPLIKLQLKK